MSSTIGWNTRPPCYSDLFNELEELTLRCRRVPQEEDVDVSSESGAVRQVLKTGWGEGVRVMAFKWHIQAEEDRSQGQQSRARENDIGVRAT